MNNPIRIEAYTDGSYDSNYGVYGGGIVLIVNESTTPLEVKVYGNKKDYAKHANAAGELLAAMHAINIALDIKATSLKIYYDFLGVHSWTLPKGTTNAWKPKTKLSRAYAVFVLRAKEAGLLIEFEHVKAHSGNLLNSRADTLAKEAIKECIKSLGTF